MGVSVSVSKNLVSEKSLSFGFGKLGLGFAFRTFDLGKQVSVSVSENLALEKSLGGIDPPRDRLRHLSGCQGEDSSKEQSISFVCSCGISRS